MMSHLKTKHPLEYSTTIRQRPSTTPQAPSPQSTIAEAFARGKKYPKDSPRWRELTNSVTHFIGKEMLPFYTVEKEGFRKMLAAFDRQYELPGRKYFSNTAIPELYNKVRGEVASLLRSIDFFSATTDMWSSNTMVPFMSLTVHFITDNWELKSRCLQTAFIPDNHTAETLNEALRAGLREWDLPVEKLACITTDNGANIVKAVRDLGWPWLNCFGHNLHLAVTNSVNDTPNTARAIGICHSIVACFSHSWLKKRDLKKAQADLNLPTHSLVKDCATRWGSQQKMMERLLEQAPAIRRVLGEDRNHSHLSPSWQDIHVMEAVNKALKPLADFTDIMSGEKHVTVSSLLPMMRHLADDVLLEVPEEEGMTASIKRSVLAKMEAKYDRDATQQLMRNSALLDPRYRGDPIKEQHLQHTKDLVIQEIADLEAAGHFPRDDVGASTSEDVEPPPQKKRRTLGSILGKAAIGPAPAELAAMPIRDRVERELERYLLVEVVGGDTSPLIWWREHQSSFPLLAKLAKKYLCICATSSPSERVFSTAGNVVTPQRSLLKPEKVNMLVFLARNL
ncbi:E3 SUMO-protein ligase ZBED1-like [Patiria miniata]|uniref:HAT C-terminal dimerisation domain-containing protein n=1 Tax=Patiria miniata TaxID=46514 RepID=A0A914AK27_PATMI|nr:E3 SUMO-protein ligase ZBED1-like [Patiria miniata]